MLIQSLILFILLNEVIVWGPIPFAVLIPHPVSPNHNNSNSSQWILFSTHWPTIITTAAEVLAWIGLTLGASEFVSNLDPWDGIWALPWHHQWCHGGLELGQGYKGKWVMEVYVCLHLTDALSGQVVAKHLGCLFWLILKPCYRLLSVIMQSRSSGVP